MASFPALSSADGLAALDKHLATRSYISGYQASRDDLSVYTALPASVDAKKYANVARWNKHITALLGASFPGTAEGVTIAGSSSSAPAVAARSAPAPSGSDSDSDDDDMFGGEMTEEEKKQMEERKKLIAMRTEKANKKLLLQKSLIVLDVKPWDDTTDLKAMEETVRAVEKEGLLWGTAKLVPVGYGIKKLQITAVIEDAKVPSMDEIIEDHLVLDGDSEYIQSVDVVSFNKL